ncbi:MAG: GNAT family N-acetyltransferase [Pseudodesulfovibrio sp.]
MAAIRRITRLTPPQHAELCALLLDSVQSGASVGFLSPLSAEEAAAYWLSVEDAGATGTILFIAEDQGTIVGSVQLVPCTRPNGRHRAEIRKLFVLAAHRGRGIGTALMATAENHAGCIGRTLLMLDTHEGSKAESLYIRLEWQRVGVIPDYAASPDGSLHGTTIFYKRIDR